MHRSLFLDSDCVNRTLTAREHSLLTAQSSSSTSGRSVVAPLPHPSPSPAVEVLEEAEAEGVVRGLGITNTAVVVIKPCKTTRLEQATPFFLDQFVGERDKTDLSKLLGVVQECFNILIPTQNNRTLKIMATNGRDQLLVMLSIIGEREV